MKWSVEWAEQADAKIKEQDYIKVSRKHWELFKEFRTKMQKTVPNHELGPWLSFSQLLMVIELEQIGVIQDD
jgi:hypothetical protein